MLFRHPSLGWLPFLLPSLERKRIEEYLATQDAQWEQRKGDPGLNALAGLASLTAQNRVAPGCVCAVR